MVAQLKRGVSPAAINAGAPAPTSDGTPRPNATPLHDALMAAIAAERTADKGTEDAGKTAKEASRDVCMALVALAEGDPSYTPELFYSEYNPVVAGKKGPSKTVIDSRTSEYRQAFEAARNPASRAALTPALYDKTGKTAFWKACRILLATPTLDAETVAKQAKASNATAGDIVAKCIKDLSGIGNDDALEFVSDVIEVLQERLDKNSAANQLLATTAALKAAGKGKTTSLTPAQRIAAAKARIAQRQAQPAN